jgi:hypothetical protein
MEMSGRAGVGLALLCALAFFAFSASNASAGQTLFTCVEGEKGTKDYSDSHCTKRVTAGTGKFGHEVISGETTDFEETNTTTVSETSSAIFKNIKGKKFEVICSLVFSEGKLTNEVFEKVMQVKGTKITTTYSGCVVLQPEKEGCKVKGEKFEATNLKSTSFQNGKELGVKFEPAEGKKLAEIVLEGCNNNELNKGYAVEGSTSATDEGATLKTTAASTEKTLKIGGESATMELTTTMRMKAILGIPQNPLTYTETIP